MGERHSIYYFTQPPGLHKLGARCVTVGDATTGPGQPYPPGVGDHPPSYRGVALAGRALEEWQIVFIERGIGSIALDVEREPEALGRRPKTQPHVQVAKRRVSAGDALLLRPDEWHRYRPDPATGWSEYWVGFSGAFLDEAAAALGLREAPAVVRVSNVREVLRLFKSLLVLADRNEVSTHMEMVAIILQILTIVSGYVHGDSPNRYSSEVVQASSLMAASLKSQGTVACSIEQIAENVGMSASAFRRRFAAELGMTPYHYFNTLRVNEVKMQLAHSGNTLRTIAERLGFTDQYHLSRVFKQYVGISPSVWRGVSAKSEKSS